MSGFEQPSGSQSNGAGSTPGFVGDEEGNRVSGVVGWLCPSRQLRKAPLLDPAFSLADRSSTPSYPHFIDYSQTFFPSTPNISLEKARGVGGE